MYEPVIGRWMMPDPKRQYFNPYLAFGNNPILRVDPNGGADGNVTKIQDGPCLCSTYDPNGNPITFNAQELGGSSDMSFLDWASQFQLIEVEIPVDKIALTSGVISSVFGLAGDAKSMKLYKDGIRLGTKGNYQLTGRNLSLFKNSPMSNATKPFTKLGGVGRTLTTGGTVLTILSTGFDIADFHNGDITGTQLGYKTTVNGMSLTAVYLIGGTTGGVVGGGIGVAGLALEMWFDGFFKYMQHLSNGIGSTAYHIKKGWDPRNMFGN